MKNPNWTKDELILALELYFRDETARGNKTHPEVLKLSQVLNSLPIHSSNNQETNFRNPSGVAMKLSNFSRFDPSYTGKGLERGNKMEKLVWDMYSANIDALTKVKNTIIENTSFLKESKSSQIEDFIEEASEGRLLTRVHKTRERNKAIVKKKKQSVLKKTGALKCETCSFDFKEIYGELGEGFAECHHKKPLSQLVANEKTKLNDLAILCANCHRMIHRSIPWKTVEELKKILKD
ncbi:MAG: HNH endonuclease [Acidimicrobiia bacterium]|nr:HNH endonuclease [Acidimicrobiia bacterium]